MTIPFGWSPARLYAYAGIAIAFAATLTFAGCEHSNAESARAARDVAKAALETAVDANASNQVTIEAQGRALDQWMKLGDSPETVRALLVAAAKTIDESTKALAAFLAAKEKDRANPECGALLGANLERACPGIARGLRSAAGGHENGPRRDPGAGAEAAPERDHRGLRAAVPVPGE
jgi:hypothetical protein